ncbi:hypothetical protein [Amorphus coralli]|uniref:hypothetical protein n=1 Tax=Amorphus coralli TaxID=340680 RepID=UPI0003615FDD|nr:hypothetical protein [Amorphus coralli]
MSEAMKTGGAFPRNPFADAFKFGSPLGDAFVSPAPYAQIWHKMMVETPLRLTAESLRYAGRRYAAQADLVAKLATCQSAADALDIQSDYFEAALGDFSVETAKLAEEADSAMFRSGE